MMNDTSREQQYDFSEWERQEAEDRLPDAVTGFEPDGPMVTSRMSRQQQHAIAKARRKEIAFFRANPGVRMFFRRYITFEDGGWMFRSTRQRPVRVAVFRMGSGPSAMVRRAYFTTDPLNLQGGLGEND